MYSTSTSTSTLPVPVLVLYGGRTGRLAILCCRYLNVHTVISLLVYLYSTRTDNTDKYMYEYNKFQLAHQVATKDSRDEVPPTSEVESQSRLMA